MKRSSHLLNAALSFAATLLLSLAPARAGAETQTFELRPGWNAIFVEVQPEPHDPASVFAGLPVESVWAWLDSHSSVEFIQDADEAGWGQAGWGVWFGSPAKAFLNSLHAVFADWAYLVRLGGDAAVTLSVSGTPSSGALRWVADSFNLVGFRVAPEAAPTFADFLSSSPAHADQPVYRLQTDGRWDLIADPGTTPIRRGEAFWVFSKGPSTYQGPLRIELPMGRALDYGTSLNELPVAVVNPSPIPRNVRFRLTSGDLVLAYRSFDSASGYFAWPPLADMAPLELDPGRQASVRLAVRREAMAAGLHLGVLEVSDDRGSRFLVPVSAEKVLP